MCGAIPYGPRHSQAQTWKGSCAVLRGLGFDKGDFHFFSIWCFVNLLLRLILTRCIGAFFTMLNQIPRRARVTRFSYHIHALSYTLVEKVFGEQGQARALPFIHICKHGSTRTERPCVSCITVGYGAVLKG
jgi:hypothetical protein